MTRSDYIWAAVLGGVALCATLGFVVFGIYQAYGEAPQRERADEYAWRQRCADKGGTLLPTHASTFKGTTRYGDWICAKVERIEP